jgi:hypothetical protein
MDRVDPCQFLSVPSPGFDRDANTFRRHCHAQDPRFNSVDVFVTAARGGGFNLQSAREAELPDALGRYEIDLPICSRTQLCDEGALYRSGCSIVPP